VLGKCKSSTEEPRFKTKAEKMTDCGLLPRSGAPGADMIMNFEIENWSQRDASRTPNRVSEGISRIACQFDALS
jgi:hypothetical protein